MEGDQMSRRVITGRAKVVPEPKVVVPKTKSKIKQSKKES